MDPLDRLRTRLAQHPALRVEHTPGGFRVVPASPGGFEVWVEGGTSGYVVGWGDWHHHPADAEAAARWGACAFSTEDRLCTEYRGQTPVRWTVEARTEADWARIAEMGSILRPFWGRRSVTYAQNVGIVLDDA